MVRVHPAKHVAIRVANLSELESAVRASVVSLRGWDFPHFDLNHRTTRHSDFVEQSIQWEHRVELWRAYKSGQFLSLSAISDDWRDQSTFWPAVEGWKPGQLIGVEDTVFRLVECFEFAARWTQRLSSMEDIVVESAVHGLKGRTLYFGDSRRSFWRNYTADEDFWSSDGKYAAATLISQPRALAIERAASLFELFHWDVKAETLQQIQSELIR